MFGKENDQPVHSATAAEENLENGTMLLSITLKCHDV